MHSTTLANRFLELAKADGKALTQMQLQKLVYIANGWNLAINNKALVSDSVQAWDYGPVYPELWEALRGYGRNPVSKLIHVRDFGFGAFMPNADEVMVAELEPQEDALVQKVFETYGKFHAFQLSAMTHKEGTPWHNVYVKNDHKKGPIPEADIKSHFEMIGKKRQVVDG